VSPNTRVLHRTSGQEVDQDMKCLKSTTVNDVVRAIESVLDQKIAMKRTRKEYASI